MLTKISPVPSDEHNDQHILCSDYTGVNTRLPKILLNGNNICMVRTAPIILFTRPSTIMRISLSAIGWGGIVAKRCLAGRSSRVRIRVYVQPFADSATSSSPAGCPKTTSRSGHASSSSHSRRGFALIRKEYHHRKQCFHIPTLRYDLVSPSDMEVVDRVGALLAPTRSECLRWACLVVRSAT